MTSLRADDALPRVSQYLLLEMYSRFCFALLLTLSCLLASSRAAVDSWSQVSPVIGGGGLLSVVHGDSRWLVVGESGMIFTSTDTQRWTRRNSGTTTRLTTAVFGQNQYLVAGQGGLILRSSDATNWSVARAAGGSSSEQISGGTYGNGRFVLVDTAGYVYGSTDGASWSQQQLSLPGSVVDFRAVTFGAGVFVAVGYSAGPSPLLFSSSDGLTWTPRAQDLTGFPSTRLVAVHYGGGRFVTIGEGGELLTSSDGVSWTLAYPRPVLSSVVFPSCLAYGNGEYVMGAYRNFGSSVDGISWVTTTGPTSTTSIAFAGGTFVTTSGNRITVKTPTRNWTVVGPEIFLNANSAAWGDGRFVLTGESGNAWATSDGEQWRSSSGGGNGFGRVAFGNGLFVAARSSPSGVHTSTDGTTWTHRAGTDYVYSATYARGRFWGGGFGYVSSSADGVAWTRQNVPITKAFLGFADGNGRLVGVGSFGALITSESGADWVIRTAPTTGQMKAIAFGAGRFVTVEGGALQFWTSTDGINWSAGSLPAAPTGGYSAAAFTDIIYAGGRFVASIGTDLLTSVDGLNWSALPRVFGDFSSGQFYLTYGNGRYMAAGSGLVFLSTPDATGITINSGVGDVFVSSGRRRLSRWLPRVRASLTSGIEAGAATPPAQSSVPPPPASRPRP